MRVPRLAVLGSTRGSDLPALIQAAQEKRLAAAIEWVLSDRAEALILEKAKTAGLKTHFINPQGRKREDFDQELHQFLEAEKIELIVLIGFMRILSADFVARWKNKILNVHPSLLPAFAGGMDKNVHAAVLAAGVSESGCTVHYVTDAVDQGPILIQKKCAVFAEDSVESLKKRVQALEGLALIEAINHFGGNKT